MSVIAKMYSNGRHPIGTSVLHTFSCVGDNEFMAHYTPSNEDILFSQYSPSGDARLIMPADFGIMDGDQFYFLFTKEKPEDLTKAIGRNKLRVHSIEDFGGTSKQCKLVTDWNPEREDNHTIMQVGYQIMIDNPGAFNQFVPGERGWWLTVYPANRVTQDEAIALAHGMAEEQADA